MKIISKTLETVENRVRNLSKMRSASKGIDQRRQKAPKGWDSAQIIRQMRQGRN